MSKLIKTAVIAGTPVDTQMGVEFIERKMQEAGTEPGFLPLYYPVSLDCDEQVKFQYTDDDGKREIMDVLFDGAIDEGARDFFIYCNSLSGSFDFDIYAVKKSIETGEDIRIYTPLQVYRSLGKEFSRVGVMAANNLSAHAIEEALMASCPDVYVIGTGNMAIVRMIEDGVAPEKIVEDCGLEEMAKYMEACGAEAIVLGCTHFPYFKDELAVRTGLSLIDPADRMFEALTEANC
ncbi:MAG: aspartate/glutamate racemase family protein [Mogibacterium sp.]|nr:aspartate/glutamate racemase family protein [Mogibacterium sp.]MBQ6499999.1 aspartate/glutamate racemase family protein [Mogibacterium sp.]